ncbi:MAG TPA: nickel pincer cofactor biosynthesis protein LarB [Solirubrobacterales bacterium]|nr:nickel pincer cofactor biosynthesis protein LarB [Solirubrobacterales bacterium]
MDRDDLQHLLESVASGDLDIDQARRRIEAAPFEDLGFARVDHHRAVRDGLPEVVLALGKTPAQVASIAASVFERAGRVLVTRVEPSHLAALRHDLPQIEYSEHARLAWLDPAPRPASGHVAVVSAGTADIPVAEEAAVTARMMGAHVSRHYDVGVAGIHRLLERVPSLRDANALVVAAGMEGALPSVVGGLVSAPVIAVPTSIGYGASFGGLAALLGMLNSCATGVAVVNIDNGFGAGFLAASINRLASDPPSSHALEGS